MLIFDLSSLRDHLSRRVKAARKARGLSQESLALQADVDRTYVSQIERAMGNPSLLILSKIATVLQVDVADLLRPPDKEKPADQPQR